MKERGILFTPENYKRSDDETKTKTRRIMEHQPGSDATWYAQLRTSGKDNGLWFPMKGDPKDSACWEQAEGKVVLCPYGVPGDRLYVKEPWAVDRRYDDMKPTDIPLSAPFYYGHGSGKRFTRGWHKVRSPLFMLRRAARLWLELTDVDAKLLQDMTEADALAEGIREVSPGVFDGGGACMGPTAVQAYMRLWESINGPGSWQKNEWIWDLTYRKVKAS